MLKVGDAIEDKMAKDTNRAFYTQLCRDVRSVQTNRVTYDKTWTYSATTQEHPPFADEALVLCGELADMHSKKIMDDMATTISEISTVGRNAAGDGEWHAGFESDDWGEFVTLAKDSILTIDSKALVCEQHKLQNAVNEKNAVQATAPNKTTPEVVEWSGPEALHRSHVVLTQYNLMRSYVNDTSYERRKVTRAEMQTYQSQDLFVVFPSDPTGPHEARL